MSAFLRSSIRDAIVAVRKISEKIQSADVAGITLALDSRLRAPGLFCKGGGLLILLEVRASHVGQRLGGRYVVRWRLWRALAVTSARKRAVRCSGAARHVPAFSKGKPHDRNIHNMMVRAG